MNPPAHQELKVTAAGNEVVRRWAICPEHEQRSSQFLGPDTEGWLFRCLGTRDHPSHQFHAAPDRTAPSDTAGVEEWMKKQRARRLREVSRGAT